MNKYFYPIYKTKLKPWIKYWLIKKTSVKPVSGTYTLASGASPLTILKALKAPIKNLTLYGDCNQFQREGTNLFDKNNIINGQRIGQGGNPFNDPYYFITNYIPVTPNTQYTSNTVFTNLYNRICFYNSNKEIISTNDGGDVSTITTPNDSNVAYMRFGKNIDYLNTLMVNKGSTSLPYEPYGYKPSPTNPSEVQTITGNVGLAIQQDLSISYRPIRLGSLELCKIGEYSDRIYKENDKWYVEKNIGKVVLNGSETWSIYNSGTANWYYYTDISSMNIISDSTATNSLCDHYLFGVVGNSNTNTGYYIVKNQNRIRIRYGTEDTIENYKTWLSNNNVSFYYVLANPNTTEITGVNLLNDLEAASQIETFKGTNEVSFSNLNPNISFEYLKEDEV